MADQNPTRRKDKQKADEYEDGESSAARRVVAEVSGQSGGGDGIPGPGIPGQDAPLLINQPHGGHLMGQEHEESSSRQVPAAASGALQTRDEYWRDVWEVSRLCQEDPMMRLQLQDHDRHHMETNPSPVPKDQRCPRCHYYEKRVEDRPYRHDCPCDACQILYAVVCETCLSAFSAPAPAGMGYLLPGQDQAAVASRPVGHGQHGVAAATGGSATQIQGNPGQNAGNNQPQAQPISQLAMEWGKRMAARTGKLQFRDDTGQAGGSRAAVPSSMDLPPPQPRHQHPPPVGAGVQQLQYQPAVGNHPVEQHVEAPGGDAANLERPVLPADQPDPGPINEDEFDSCSACRERLAPVRPQPRKHACICPKCVSDTVECVVCNYDIGFL